MKTHCLFKRTKKIKISIGYDHSSKESNKSINQSACYKNLRLRMIYFRNKGNIVYFFYRKLVNELYICVLPRTFFLYYTYGLLAECEVKMAGYWPSSFFACLWTETGSRSINSQKKNKKRKRPISSHLDWTNLAIKDLVSGFWLNFSSGIRRVVPSGQDSSTLPAWVANHSAGFDSSCPFTDLAM